MTRLLALVLLVFALHGEGAFAADDMPKMMVWKNPQCGCCGKWVDHLRAAGFTVEVNETENINKIKRKFGIPEPLTACHTATIGNYYVEGHVPADAVKELLVAKPKIVGLAVPGMPMGSPGMEVESGEVEAYEVRAVDASGASSVFKSYP